MLKRFYQKILQDHLTQFNQMLFISGPRQVGKTTLSKVLTELSHTHLYLNWDVLQDREVILSNWKSIEERLSLDQAMSQKPIIIFDEIHKYSQWKTYIKGFFDTYKDKISIIVTGSAHLNIYKTGGDSLMGRYFQYRIHPLSVREVVDTHVENLPLIKPPMKMDEEDWHALYEFGGFPDPFLQKDPSFYQRWQSLRNHQLFQEDVRDLSRVMEIAQMEVLAKILASHVGQLSNYSNLSRLTRINDKTVRSWIEILKSLYYCFSIKPWTTNVIKSLTRESKLYLWDWSTVQDPGQRVENLVASHLLKAVHYWQDAGLGQFDLHFVRDQTQREVDFLVTKEEKPWMLVEVKSSHKAPLSSSLRHFHGKLKTEHAFQVAYDLAFQEIDLFALQEPKIVSMRTFLSQLV